MITGLGSSGPAATLGENAPQSASNDDAPANMQPFFDQLLSGVLLQSVLTLGDAFAALNSETATGDPDKP